MRRIAALAALLSSVALSACTTTAYRPRLTTAIGDDAAGFSIAYSRAANNQLLLRIFEARDQLPRNYVTVSGISDNPTATNSLDLNVNPLNLNNALDPYRASSSKVATSIVTKPTYGVTPLPPENLAKGIYAPLQPSTFQHYWTGEWSKELLVRVLLRDSMQGSCTNLTASEVLNRSSLALVSDPAAATGLTPACVFAVSNASVANADLAQRMTSSLNVLSSERSSLSVLTESAKLFSFQERGEKSTNPPLTKDKNVLLLPVSQKECRTAVSVASSDQRDELLKMAAADKAFNYSETAAGATLTTCETVRAAALIFVTKDSTAEEVFVLNPRSFEQIVGYLGQQLRSSECEKVGTACVFRVHQEPDNQIAFDYAASLEYRGKRYFAGLAQGQSVTDHSGAVLTILSQLYSLAASPDALKPPTRFVVN